MYAGVQQFSFVCSPRQKLVAMELYASSEHARLLRSMVAPSQVRRDHLLPFCCVSELGLWRTGQRIRRMLFNAQNQINGWRQQLQLAVGRQLCVRVDRDGNSALSQVQNASYVCKFAVANCPQNASSLPPPFGICAPQKVFGCVMSRACPVAA